MRRARSAFNSAAALQRVFITPIEHYERPHLAFQRQPLLGLYSISQHRNYARLKAAPQLHGAKARLPRDDEIKSRYIHVVDDNGRLSEPVQTARVRASINPKTHILMTVAMPPVRHDEEGLADEIRDDDGQPRIPVCKIQSKQVLRDQEKATQKQKKNPTNVVKTLEINWAIDPHDLDHRLVRLQEFLSKGNRVEIVMASKKKGRRATVEEAQALLKKVRAAVKEVDGAREWKVMDGQALAQATMYIEGKETEP